MLVHDVKWEGFFWYAELYHVFNEWAICVPHHWRLGDGSGDQGLGSTFLPDDEFSYDWRRRQVLLSRVLHRFFLDGLEVVLEKEVGWVDPDLH